MSAHPDWVAEEWEALMARIKYRNGPARHNSLDYDCGYWVGDMHPAENDPDNREFSGESSRLDDRRCVVCRPYTIEEADALVEAGFADRLADLEARISGAFEKNWARKVLDRTIKHP